MRKTMLTISAAVLLSSLFTTACSSSETKVQEAEAAVQGANEDLEKANAEYKADVEKYRLESQARIDANNKAVVEFEAKIANEKAEVREDYRKKIAEINQRNTDMQKRMTDYTPDNREKWESFKTEFGRDMDELGNALRDLTVKNTK